MMKIKKKNKDRWSPKQNPPNISTTRSKRFVWHLSSTGLFYIQNILFYNESGATVSISIKYLLGTYMAIIKPLFVMEKYLRPDRSNKRSTGVVALITPVGLGRNPFKEGDK